MRPLQIDPGRFGSLPCAWRASGRIRTVAVSAAFTATAVLGGPAMAAGLRVAVTIEPQAFFVERIGGPEVQVQVLVGQGQCAETYEPTPKQIARLAEARVFFTIGMPMEETFVPRLRSNFPALEVVDARAGIPVRTFESDRANEADRVRRPTDHEHAGHAHADGGPAEHGHGGGGHAGHLHAGEDPHVWLSPRLAKVLAANVAEGLARVDPAHADDYRARALGLAADLDSLDAELAATLAPVRGRDLLVYHPFYGYLADAYGLRQVSIEIGGFKPGSKYLTQVVKRARADGGKAVFVQEGAATASAETVAREIGARVVTLDPMSRDYVNNLRTMAVRIRDGILGK